MFSCILVLDVSHGSASEFYETYQPPLSPPASPAPFRWLHVGSVPRSAVQARALDIVIREQHRKASANIFAGINAALQQQWKTDLHAMLPAEVSGRLDAVFNSLCGMGGKAPAH